MNGIHISLSSVSHHLGLVALSDYDSGAVLDCQQCLESVMQPGKIWKRAGRLISGKMCVCVTACMHVCLKRLYTGIFSNGHLCGNNNDKLCEV